MENHYSKEERTEIIALITLTLDENRIKYQSVKLPLHNFFSWDDENSIWTYFSDIFNYKLTSNLFIIQIEDNSKWKNIYDIASFYYYLIINSKKQLIKIKINSISNLYQKSNYIDIINQNAINMQPVKCSNIFFTCAICHGASNNEFLIQRLGNFYGPFIDNNNYYYAHFLCLYWLPSVYINDNTFSNVIEEIRRARMCNCSFCGKSGAGLTCIIENCRESFHFRCIDKAKCVVDKEKQVIYCPFHIEVYECKDENNHGTQLKKAICTYCKKEFEYEDIANYFDKEAKNIPIDEKEENVYARLNNMEICQSCWKVFYN